MFYLPWYWQKRDVSWWEQTCGDLVSLTWITLSLMEAKSSQVWYNVAPLESSKLVHVP